MKALDSKQPEAPDAQQSPDPVTGSVPVWKRVLDTLCILLAAPFLLPIGLLIVLAIKLASPGPVLFAQERVGFRGKLFRCFKFRTMAVNASTEVHQGHLQALMASDRPMIKLDGADKRLIPGGRFLRCLGLDELPQLINVLRGEMSLVGPRPCLPYECELYQPRHWRRFGTLPGLTGLWQVNGKNRTTFEEMINFDVKYVETKSPLLDLAIMIRTFPAILVQVWDTVCARSASVHAAAGAPPGSATSDRSRQTKPCLNRSRFAKLSLP